MPKFDLGRSLVRRMGFASLLALGALGCARGPDVSATGLSLQRVVIYRNGVAYFERAGKVDSTEVTFRVRREKVGDFLATLAVIEAGGSSVQSASFPVEVAGEDEEEEASEPSDPRYEILLKPPPSPKKDKEKKDKLETVKLTLDGKEHDLIVGYVAETPVWRPSYRLVITKGKATGADLQAWGIVQNLSGEDWKGVKLSLVAGAPLAFQATLDKAVIPQRPVVTDQGEVIASVPTSETSLAQGAPPPPPPPAAEPAPDDMAQADMDAEYEPSEGDGYDRREKGAVATGSGRGGASGKKAPSRSAASRSAPAGAVAPGSYPMAPPPPGLVRPMDAMPMQRQQSFSPPRNVNALAAVAMEAGTTRYDIPFPVDIPDKSATMVLLLARPVPGESIFLYAPDPGVPDSRSHPFRVARFSNNTKGLLERGPIAVFENGSFLGQGMVDPLPPGATATVPFALERSLAVDQTRTENEEGARVARIEAGQLTIERDWVVHTKYAFKNGSDEDAKAMVKHPRLYGTRLHDAPKGTEDNLGTGSALVPVTVTKRGTAVLDVDERRIQQRYVDWLSQLADEAVKSYMADARADAGVVRDLKAAWEVRGKLRGALDEKDKLQAESNLLENQSDELRRNLRAIEKNKTAEGLRRDLTDRLAKAAARLDEITKRVIVLEMQINEQSIRFRDLINGIKMLKALSPVKG
jgi:hypothetical protein